MSKNAKAKRKAPLDRSNLLVKVMKKISSTNEEEDEGNESEASPLKDVITEEISAADGKVVDEYVSFHNEIN